MNELIIANVRCICGRTVKVLEGNTATCACGVSLEILRTRGDRCYPNAVAPDGYKLPGKFNRPKILTMGWVES